MPNSGTIKPAPYDREQIDRHGSEIALVQQQQNQTSRDVARLSDALSAAAKEWAVNLTNLQAQFRAELSTVSKDLSKQIEDLAGELRKNREINWQPYGILLSVLVVIGGLVYWPIDKEQQNQRENFNSLVTTIASNNKAMSDQILSLTAVMRTEFVSQKEYNTARTWAEGERNRVNIELRDLRDNIVPRGEHDQQWKTEAERITNVQETARNNFNNLMGQVVQIRSDFQRQIDELKTAQGAVYGSRDVILAQGSKIEYLERQITELLRTLGTAKSVSPQP